MALAPDDDLCHEPEDVERWQENFFLLGWDSQQHSGIYLHLGRIAAAGETEVRAGVIVDGKPVSSSSTGSIEASFRLPGLTVDVEEPFSRWHVTFEGMGAAGPSPEGWLAEADGGDVRYGFDVTTSSSLPPVDWRDIGRELGLGDMVADHYEVGATWEGEVWAGERRVGARGLLIRDHSWGPRDASSFDLGWWTPMCFDEASVFVSGASILRGGRWHEFTVIDAGSGPSISRSNVVRVAGTATPGGYTGASMFTGLDGGAVQRFDYTPEFHFPARYPSFGGELYLNDAYCAVQWGERQGFGVLELNHR